MDHEFLKVSSFSKMLLKLALREKSVGTIIKSLVQYGKTFDLGYDRLSTRVV